MDEIEKRLNNLENEETSDCGQNIVITVLEDSTVIGPDGERHRVPRVPVGYSEGDEWRDTGNDRIRVRYAKYTEGD